MKTAALAGTSLKISPICLGSAGFGDSTPEAEACKILDTFRDAGGNFVDTANVYGKWLEEGKNCSEEILGRWLKSRNACHDMVIATKGGHYRFDAPQTSRVYERAVREDVEESLRTLGLDCIDLYWLHRDNEAVPVEEIMGMMETLTAEGKLRYYGASNFKLMRMKAATAVARAQGMRGFCAVSNRWSLASVNPAAEAAADPTLVATTDAFYQWHRASGMPLIPYSASGSGFFEKLYQACPEVRGGMLLSSPEALRLPENMKKAYLNERNLKIYEDLLRLREKYHASLYTLSMACLMNQAFPVVPVSSVRNTEQLAGFLRAGALDVEEKLVEKYISAAQEGSGIA